MKHVNQLKIGVVLAYVSTGLEMVIQLTYTPVMIRILGQSEYGLYTLVASFVSYLSLFSLGFTGAYLRFYSRYKERKDAEGVAQLNGMFLSIFMIMAIAAFLSGMVMAQNTSAIFGNNLTGPELAKAKVLMEILVVNIALTFPSSIFNSVVSAHEQFLFQRVVNLLGIVFNPLICLPLLFLGYGSVAIVVIATSITVFKLIASIVFCKKRLNVKFKFTRFDSGLLKEIGAFSFFIFLNMIIDQINWSVDKFILGWVSGTAAVAHYGVGANINTMFTGFSTAVSSVFAPRVNRIAAANQEDMKMQFTELFTRVGRVQFLILSLVATGIIFFGQYFITNIYATPEYKESYGVSLLLIIPVMIPLIQNVGIEIQRSVNKHQFRAIAYTIMALINIGISIPLAQKFGPNGAALGTCISLITANGLIMNVYYHKVIGINVIFFWKNIIDQFKGLIIPCILGVGIVKFVAFNGIFSFLCWIMIYTIVYASSMWLFGMNQYEKNLFRNAIKKIINKD